MKITNVNNYKVVVKVDKTKEVAEIEEKLLNRAKSTIILTESKVEQEMECERNAAFSRSCTGILVQLGPDAFVNNTESVGSKLGDRVLFPRDEGIVVVEYNDDDTVNHYRILSDSQVLGSVELQTSELDELVSNRS